MWLIRCANPTTQQLWRPLGGQLPARRRTLNAVEYFRVGRKLSKTVLRFKKAFLLENFIGLQLLPYPAYLYHYLLGESALPSINRLLGRLEGPPLPMGDW